MLYEKLNKEEKWMLAIEIFNIVFTSLGWVVIIYPIAIIFIIIALIFKIIGFKGIKQRFDDGGIRNTIKNSIYFELYLAIFVTLLIPVVLVTAIPEKIIFEAYVFEKAHWVITPFMIFFFLSLIPMNLFVGLYIHNTQGMIFVLYSIPLGYLLSWLIDRAYVFEITPPYLILAMILWAISWASSGLLKGQKRVGYVCLAVDEEDVEKNILKPLDSYVKNIKKLTKGKRKSKKRKKKEDDNIEESISFKGKNVAIQNDGFSGAYVHDYMIEYIPLAIMFRRLFKDKFGFLKLPYAFSINTMLFKDLRANHTNLKYFIHKGSIYEYKSKNKAINLSSEDKSFNDTQEIVSLGITDETPLIVILPTCSDIVNAFFFVFGTIKIRLITAVVKEKKRSFLYSYIWAPGSLVPSPLAYLTLEYVKEKLKIKNPLIWLFNFAHDFGSKYMVRFNLKPIVTSIKPVEIKNLCNLTKNDSIIQTDSEIDTFVNIANQYVESETTMIIIRKKISKAVLLTLSVIGALVTMFSLFGFFI